MSWHVSRAQRLITSRSADFSTQDTRFSFSDTLYILVEAPRLDFTALKKNRYKLEPENDGSDYEVIGSLENHFNGTYTANIPLSMLNPLFVSWELEVELQDEFKAKFKEEVNLSISDQRDTQGDVILSGEIEALDDAYFIVSERTILVTEQTVVLENGRPIDFSELEPGWKVKIIAQRMDDGSLVARQIEVLKRKQIGEKLEVEGRISKLTDTSLFITDTEFFVNEETEIKARGDEVPFSYLQLGMKVKVEANALPTGDYIAEEIEVLDETTRNKKIYLFGEITEIHRDSIFPDTLKIDNQYFEITPSSRFYSFSKESIAHTELRIGEELQVAARTRGPNKPPMIEEGYRYLNTDVHLDVQGKVENYNNNILTIFGIEIYIHSKTIFLNAALDFLGPVTLSPNQLVRVLANEDEQKRYIAETIIILDDLTNEFTISDLIQEIAEDWLQIGDKIFSLSPQTLFFDQVGQPVSLDFFQIGDFVEVRARVLEHESYQALEIWLRGLRENEISIRAPILDFVEDSLVVEGFQLSVNERTKFFLEDGNPTIDVGAFDSGKIIEILASREQSRWVARSLSLEKTLDEEMAIAAKIQAMGSGSITLLQKQIQFTPQSEFRGMNGEPLQLSDFSPGEWVLLRARATSDQLYFGWRLEKYTPQSGFLEVKGPIQSISSTFVSLQGISFSIDGSAKFRDALGNLISLEDFKPGMVIRVKGSQIGQLLLALELQLLSVVKITGEVAEMQADRLGLADRAYRIAPDVLVLDTTGLPTTLETVKSGQQVQLLVDLSTTPDAEILRIRILRDVVTSVLSPGPHVQQPASFQLLQSYPNPISARDFLSMPSTIRFLLSRPEQVSLAVYDILGRQVRILIARQDLAPGEYQIQWDGRDTRGRLVAPGLYFFLMRAGGRTLSRKTIILP